jgi:hypothetical protein
MTAQLSSKDYEAFSAYLDDQLDPAEKTQLEAKLAADSQLRLAFEELSSTRTLLRKARQYRAPRNFTLTPEMAQKARRQSIFSRLPAFRFSMALSALSLIAVFLLEMTSLVPSGVSQVALAPAYAPQAMEKSAPSADAQAEPTMEIQWQNGMPADGIGGGPSSAVESVPGEALKIQPGGGGGYGGGGGGDGNPPVESPLTGPIQLPAESVEGLSDSAPLPMATAAPEGTQPSIAAEENPNPILGIPPESDGGKMITSSGELEEIPVREAEQPLVEEQTANQTERSSAPGLPVRRAVELALLVLALLAGAAALIFRRAARR